MHISPGNRPLRANNDNALTSKDTREDSEDATGTEQVEQREGMPPEDMGASGSGSKVSSTETETTTVTSPTPSGSHPARERNETPIVKKEVQETIADGVRHPALYGYDVLPFAFERMREPLWIVVICLAAWLSLCMAPLFRMAFSPLCSVLWISNSTLCVPVQPAQVPLVNFKKLVDIQGSTFERLVVESAGGWELSINVLRTEMATQDLSLLVRYSDLKSKDDIADMLHAIAADAKKTGRGLSKLNAKVVGAIDDMIALNNYVLVTIEGTPGNALLQAISPIKLGPTSDEIVAEAYTISMDESERAIRKLVVEAEGSLQNLEQLNADIETLQDMVAREGIIGTTGEKDRIFWDLWRESGRNGNAYDDRRALLDSLGEYGRLAIAYVKGTILALEAMRDDMEDLRQRVVAPGLLGSKIPVHVHIQSIQGGLERLREGRMILRSRAIGEETVKIVLNNGRS